VGTAGWGTASTRDTTTGIHGGARQLRRLEISPAPLAVFSYLDHRSILPAGSPIGAARGYHDYADAGRPLGRFTGS
jgi:hypothetical protein